MAMRAIKDADVILFILDARMPDLSRNKDLEKKLKNSGKAVLVAFNKIDLISSQKLKNLREKYPGNFFISVTEKKGVKELRVELMKLSKKIKVDKLEVGIVGYPNVGKSALTNLLSRAAKTKVSSKAGTTTSLQWASSSSFKILDSPGVVPFEDDEVKLGILGAKNPEKLKDPERVAIEIIKICLRNNEVEFRKHYGIGSEESDEYEILIKIGESKKLLKKKGIVDEKRASMMIIRDWQSGKLSRK